LAAKFEVPESIFNVAHCESAELTFVGLVTLFFKLVELRPTDVVPTGLKRTVTFEPFLLKVVESLRFHFTPKIVALRTCGNQIVVLG
jgi:hypothetical protein